MNDIVKLTEIIRDIVDIHGVSIGRQDDKSTWRVDYRDENVSAETTAAVQAIIDAFVFSTAEEIKVSAEKRKMLDDSRDKVIAHMEEKMANILPSMSDADFERLVNERKVNRAALNTRRN